MWYAKSRILTSVQDVSSQHNTISSLAYALGLEGTVHVQQLALEGGATASTTAVGQLLQHLGGGTQARQVVAHVSVEIRKTSQVAPKGTRGYCIGQSGISRGLCQNIGGRVVAAVQYKSIASDFPGVAAAVASLACVVASTLVPIAIVAPLSMMKLLLLKLLKLLLLLNLLRQVIQRQIQNGRVLVGYISRCYQTQKVFDAGGASYVEAVRIPECRQSR